MCLRRPSGAACAAALSEGDARDAAGGREIVRGLHGRGARGGLQRPVRRPGRGMPTMWLWGGPAAACPAPGCRGGGKGGSPGTMPVRVVCSARQARTFGPPTATGAAPGAARSSVYAS